MGVELGMIIPVAWPTVMNGGLPVIGDWGLQESVNANTYYLHDGRARNLTEAIMWHGGEGAASRTLFSSHDKRTSGPL